MVINEIPTLRPGHRIYIVDTNKFPSVECPICCSLDTIDAIRIEDLENYDIILILSTDYRNIFRCSFCENIFVG